MRIVIGLLLAIVLCGCGGGSGDANGIGPAGVGPSPAGHWLSTTTGAFDIFSTTAGGYIAVFSDKRIPRMPFVAANDGGFTMQGTSTDTRTGEVIDYLVTGRFTTTSMNGTY